MKVLITGTTGQLGTALQTCTPRGRSPLHEQKGNGFRESR